MAATLSLPLMGTGSCGAAYPPTWGRGLAVVPGEEPQPSQGGRGRGAPGRGALPMTQAENYVGLACSLLRRASWWEGFLSPARRESACSSPVLQPRELPSEIRRSQHCGGQERVPEPSRESQPRLGVVQRGHNPGTGGRHPQLGATISV